MWARTSTSYKAWVATKDVIKTRVSKPITEGRGKKGNNVRGLEEGVVVVEA